MIQRFRRRGSRCSWSSLSRGTRPSPRSSADCWLQENTKREGRWEWSFDLSFQIKIIFQSLHSISKDPINLYRLVYEEFNIVFLPAERLHFLFIVSIIFITLYVLRRKNTNQLLNLILSQCLPKKQSKACSSCQSQPRGRVPANTQDHFRKDQGSKLATGPLLQRRATLPIRKNHSYR